MTEDVISDEWILNGFEWGACDLGYSLDLENVMKQKIEEFYNNSSGEMKYFETRKKVENELKNFFQDFDMTLLRRIFEMTDSDDIEQKLFIRNTFNNFAEDVFIYNYGSRNQGPYKEYFLIE